MNNEEPFLPELEIPEGMEPGSPRSGPIFTYTPWPSLCTAFLASTGINAALYARERTGRGQHVETSLLQAAFTLTASFLILWVMKVTVGIRAEPAVEAAGLDVSEHGMWGYPEFYIPVPGGYGTESHSHLLGHAHRDPPIPEPATEEQAA